MLQNLTTIEVLSLLMLNNELVISVLMDHSSTGTDLASRQVGGKLRGIIKYNYRVRHCG